MLKDRKDAGERLAEQLQHLKANPQGVVFALPRGGIVVGYRICLRLHLPLHVFITRKLRAPGNPELAIGALAETGTVLPNQDIMHSLFVSEEDLQGEIRFQREEIYRRQVLYREGKPLPSLAGRVVIVVDDGIATGATFLVSLQAIRKLRPGRLIGAIPVGPEETLARVRKHVDELMVLEQPEPFYAVGNHYVDFQQVEDEDVMRYLLLASEAVGNGIQRSPS